MRRFSTWLVCVVLLLVECATLRPLSAATPSWQQRYDAAQQLLVDGKDAQAAVAFAELADQAATQGDRRVCAEMESLARRRLAARQNAQLTSPNRTPEELSVLYTSAFIYGFGTSAWVALLMEPAHFAGAVIPFALITTASIGSVAIADGYRPLRLGVPKAITSGMYLGFGEGLWLVGAQHAGGTRRDDGSRWGAKTTATVLWTSATLGAVAGGAIGAHARPRPGRISLTSSLAIWSGIVGSFAGAAIQPNQARRTETVFLAGAAGYNLGLISAFLVPDDVSPSVARVRFTDLGGLAGGLLGASAYILARGDDATPRGGLGSAGLGSAIGLGLAWWATKDMASEQEAQAARLVPTFSSLDGDGLTVGLSGTF